MSRQPLAPLTFIFEVNSNNAKAAAFTLRYELDKATVTVKLDDVKRVSWL